MAESACFKVQASKYVLQKITRPRLCTAKRQKSVRHHGGHDCLEGTTLVLATPECLFQRKKSVCIIHDGCYFHHMLLSGAIVIPAPSAQSAPFRLCPTLSSFLLLLLFPFVPSFQFIPCLMEMELEAPLTVPAVKFLVFFFWEGGGAPKVQLLVVTRQENGCGAPCIISHSK